MNFDFTKDIVIVLAIILFLLYIKSERLRVFSAILLTILSILLVAIFLIFKKEDLANLAAYFTFIFLLLDLVIYSSLIIGDK